MAETTTTRCSDHHFVDMIHDETYGESFADRNYSVARFSCPVKGCRSVELEAVVVR